MGKWKKAKIVEEMKDLLERSLAGRAREKRKNRTLVARARGSRRMLYGRKL